MTDTEAEAEGQGVLPFDEATGELERDSWQLHAVRRMTLTAFTVAVGIALASGLEALYGVLDTPPWVTWPLRTVLAISFVIPISVAIVGDGWSVVTRQWVRFKGWRDD